MNKVLFFALLALIIGCRSYVQVFDTKGSIPYDGEGFYVFENDTVRITYSFWNEKGLMSFSIYNKQDKPLYIDWRKSSYIDNSVKLNYWEDEEKSKVVNSSKDYYYTGSSKGLHFTEGNFNGVSNISTKKIERITFIPPRSNIYKSQFYIMPSEYYKFDLSTEPKEEFRKDIPTKSTDVYYQNFSMFNSPLVFRNFLTFSFSEKFDSEFSVDNEFFIDKIIEMDKRHFEQYRLDETKNGKWLIKDKSGSPILFNDYKNPRSFYLKIPAKKSVQKRKFNSF